MKHVIEVRGTWAGDASPGWRPAIAGTLNQTGFSDEEASSFDTREEAEGVLEGIRRDAGVPDEPACGVPEFRIIVRLDDDDDDDDPSEWSFGGPLGDDV